MKLWTFMMCISVCYNTFSQSTPERIYIDSVIQQHCNICLKGKNETFSSLENLFHKSHVPLTPASDNERLVAIMKATELARSENDQHLLFFYSF